MLYALFYWLVVHFKFVWEWLYWRQTFQTAYAQLWKRWTIYGCTHPITWTKLWQYSRPQAAACPLSPTRFYGTIWQQTYGEMLERRGWKVVHDQCLGQGAIAGVFRVQNHQVIKLQHPFLYNSSIDKETRGWFWKWMLHWLPKKWKLFRRTLVRKIFELQTNFVREAQAQRAFARTLEEVEVPRVVDARDWYVVMEDWSQRPHTAVDTVPNSVLQSCFQASRTIPWIYLDFHPSNVWWLQDTQRYGLLDYGLVVDTSDFPSVTDWLVPELKKIFLF